LKAPPQELLLAQLGLELVLLVLLLALLWRIWKRPQAALGELLPGKASDILERFLSESQRITETFAKSLEDRQRISTSIIDELDRALNGYRDLLVEIETAVNESIHRLDQLRKEEGLVPPGLQAGSDGKANPAAPEVRALVLKLHKEGLNIEDIAVRSRLHRGEVELILELARQFDS
jgi:hypothetical protein